MSTKTSVPAGTDVGAARDRRLTDDLLVALMEADQEAAAPRASSEAVPDSPRAVTAEWLTTVLGADVPGAAVVSTAVVDEHDGMADRMRLAVHWNDAGRRAGLPAGLFVKATPHREAHRNKMAILHLGELEAQFYQQLGPELPGLAPRAYLARTYSAGRFLYLLQDLESSGCQPFWLKDECSVEHARAVVVTLARLHTRFWESERFVGDLSWVRPRTQRFGWPMLRDQMRGVRAALLESEHAEVLSPYVRDLLVHWNENDDAVYAYWEGLEQTVLHGDSHFGNTFAHPDGSAGLFDWQVMFRGHGVRDLAYFVISALPDEVRRAHETSLFDLYLSTLAEGGVELDRAQAWANYGLFVLDSLDGNAVVMLHGTYNHDPRAVRRAVTSLVSALEEHDVTGLVRRIARTGSIG